MSAEGQLDSSTMEESDKKKLENEPLTEEMEKTLASDYAKQLEERLRNKKRLRDINASAHQNRPDETYFHKLDSSLKKNSAFVRKLRNFTETQQESLLKDMETLNLTKYVSEVAAALVDAKLKMGDVGPAVTVVSRLHQQYAEFSQLMMEQWQRVLTFKKEDKITNPSKLRVDLRFYSELISIGVFSGKDAFGLLGNILTMLVSMDKEEHKNMSVVLSFCRHCGEDFAGLVSKKIRTLADKYHIPIPRSDFLAPERQRNVKQLLRDYYNSICKHLVREHKELQGFERHNRRILQTKGELSAERREKMEVMQANYSQLYASTQSFAEILDEELPELPHDSMELTKQEEAITVKIESSEEPLQSGSVWDDEDTRTFYECLPDIRTFLTSVQTPSSATSTSPAPASTAVSSADGSSSAEPAETSISQSEDHIAVKDKLKESSALDEKPDTSSSMDDSGAPDEMPISTEEKERITSEGQKDDIQSFDFDEVDEVDTSNVSSTSRAQMDSFLSQLPKCVSRELIDAAAVDFVLTLNTKQNRKRLARALFMTHRTRLDILPLYSRLVTVLNPIVPEVASDLGQMLRQDFRYQVNKKDQINIESKVKVVRFIGELVKFGVFPQSDALDCLKTLLGDFTHHHIEMACNLLEVCGRFIFMSAESQHRLRVYLEQLMRKKTVMALDARYSTMIEAAYYSVMPPNAPVAAVKKTRPPLFEYVRYIIFRELDKATTDKILRQLRKLNWDNPDLSTYVVKCLTNVSRVKFYNIRCLANLVSGLAVHQEAFGFQVVDSVLEEIRIGMEVNHPRYNQRRVAMVKYLGELYNYRMVESADIFKTLYSLITFGVVLDLTTMSPLDPPEHLFRLRLVCVLLDTCGQYFVSGASKRKLDYFFVYFQRYFWYKKSVPLWNEENPFPWSVEFMVHDAIVGVRPHCRIFTSSDECFQAVGELETEFRAKYSHIIDFDQGKESNDKGLQAIAEIDEPATDEGGGGDGHCERTAPDSEHVGGSCSLSQSSPLESQGSDDIQVSQASHASQTNNLSSSVVTSTQQHRPSALNSLSQSGTVSGGTGSMEQDSDIDVGGAPKLVSCQEDDDFLAAFDSMLCESIQDRIREPTKRQNVDIAVPMHIKSSGATAKKTYEQLQEIPSDSSDTISFVLMIRKGNKPQYKNVALPADSELAQNLKNREEADRLEKERFKRLTLDINERLEEEDYQETLSQCQRPTVVNLNRDRRHKYQPPRGAPDADVIFGRKKVR